MGLKETGNYRVDKTHLYLEKVKLHLLSPRKFIVRVPQNKGNSLTRLVRLPLLRGVITILYTKNINDERQFKHNP